MTRPVIRIISVDNYDDVTGSLPDATMFQKSTHSWQGLFLSLLKAKHIQYRRDEGDRFTLTQYSVLTGFMDQKVSVDDFRQQAQKRGLPLTLKHEIRSVQLKSMIKSVRLPCRI